jgi:thymidine kinase
MSHLHARIEIILGPMFSGKSTELIRRCSRLSAIGKNVLYINHSFDSRTDDFIQTHSLHKQSALKISSFTQIPLEEYDRAEVIGIDEAQFFPDLYEFVLKCESDGKTVIMSGLDGDSNRRPFGQILECIPLCDSVVKLTSMDMISRDGTDAIFSMRMKQETTSGQVCIGAEDKYVAVSRQNYLKYNGQM